MKKRICFLFWVIIFSFPGIVSGDDSAPDTVAALEIPGMQWGAPASDYPEFSAVGEQGEVRRYVKKNESLAIANIKPERVVYGFYRDRYFAAYLMFPSASGFESVKAHVIDLYGSPRAQLRVSQTVYIWERKNVKVKLKRFEKEKGFKVGLYFTPISTEVNDSRLEKGFEKSIQLKSGN